MRKQNIILLAGLFLCSTYSFSQEMKEDFTVFDDNIVEEEKKSDTYTFSTTYRIEAGYTQYWQNSKSTSYADTYLHGAKIGATVDFNLPYHLSIQTGLLYQITYGRNQQHWGGLDSEYEAKEYLEHNLLKQSIVIPVYATYTQKLWKELALYFYTGPQFNIGISQKDKIADKVSDKTRLWLDENNIPTKTYDKYSSKELRIFNLQWSLGGGIQWANYRLYSGYNFGLNNLVKSNNNYLTDSRMSEWSWFVSFSYAF